MSQTILKPLSNGLYTSPKAVAHLFEFSDPDDANSFSKGVRLGDMGSFSVSVSIEKSEIESNEYGVSTVVKSSVSKTAVEVSIECKQLSPLVQAASVQGRVEDFSQAEALGQSMDLTASEPGVYFLGGYGVTLVSVVDGAGDALTEGTDYLFDASGGQIEIMTPCVVTYDIPEITSGFATGIASGKGIRGRIALVGVNDLGVKTLLVLNDVELTPSGAREFVTSGADPQTISLSGTAYPKADEKPGHEFGFIKNI